MRDRSYTTFSQVGVYAHVPSGASEVFLLLVRYVFAGDRVDVLFGQSEICDIRSVLYVTSIPKRRAVDAGKNIGNGYLFFFF